jgi:hypothetical protein
MAETLTPELTFGNYIYGTGTDTISGMQRKTIWLGNVFPQSLFSTGLAGAWYDPSDLSTLFQDSAGTTPVTASGQPVGKMLDKSGNGNHVIQATAAARPLLVVASSLYYLQFDGVDDDLRVNSPNLRIVGDLTLSAGMYKNGAGSIGGIMTCLTAEVPVDPYEWRFTGAAALTPEIVWAGAGPFNDIVAAGPNDIGSLATPTVASMRRIVGTSAEHSINKLRAVYAATVIPTSDASSTFVIGNRLDAGIPLAGRFYGGLVIASNLSNADLAAYETLVGTKCGLSI